MERITKKRCRGGDFRFLRGVIQSDHISNLVEVRFRVFVAKRQGGQSKMRGGLIKGEAAAGPRAPLAGAWSDRGHCAGRRSESR